MGQGDHRGHREAEVTARPRIVTDRSITGGEFHHANAGGDPGGEPVVRGQLLVDRLVLDEVRPELPEGTRQLPPSSLDPRRLRLLRDWAAGGDSAPPGSQGYGGGDEASGGGGRAATPGRGAGGEVEGGYEEGEDDREVPYARFELPPGEDLVCIVRRLRRRFGAYVGPNHVSFSASSPSPGHRPRRPSHPVRAGRSATRRRLRADGSA